MELQDLYNILAEYWQFDALKAKQEAKYWMNFPDKDIINHITKIKEEMKKQLVYPYNNR